MQNQKDKNKKIQYETKLLKKAKDGSWWDTETTIKIGGKKKLTRHIKISNLGKILNPKP